MAILPAMAVSTCGGSRLTHDAILSCYFLIELKGGRWTAPSGDTYAC
jgi:hypothetical protein